MRLAGSGKPKAKSAAAEYVIGWRRASILTSPWPCVNGFLDSLEKRREGADSGYRDDSGLPGLPADDDLVNDLSVLEADGSERAVDSTF